MRLAPWFTVAVCLIAASACKKDTQTAPPPVAVELPKPPPPPPPPPLPPEPKKEIEGNFARVFFETDSSTLGGESLDALKANAALLQELPNLVVEVQGHADERGTTDYNLALGDRRANAVRDALVRMGVAEGQVRTISFGEERPAGSVYSKNRRAEFRLVSQAPSGVQGTID